MTNNLAPTKQFRPGHLAYGPISLGFERLRGPCKVCTQMFPGQPNQQVCNPCRTTPDGREFLANRTRQTNRKSMRRASGRKKSEAVA